MLSTLQSTRVRLPLGLFAVLLLHLLFHNPVSAQTCGSLIKNSTSEYFLGIIQIDGTLMMWGSNSYGQLGDNTTTLRSLPIRVLKGAYSGTTYIGDNPSNPVVAAVLGDFHSLAVMSDGTVYAWGYDGAAALGNNAVSPVANSTPVRVLKGQYPGTTYLGDVSSNKIIGVGAGEHSLAFAANGTVYAWGDNYAGQLGDNTLTQRQTPVLVLKGQYSGTTYLGDNTSNPIVGIGGGVTHSIAVSSNGNVYAWGENLKGELGINSTTKMSTPVRVLKGQYGGTTYLGDNTAKPVIQVSAGWNSSAALTSNGEVYVWGRNQVGQNGNNTTTTNMTPVRVLKGQYPGTTYLGDNTANKITKLILAENSVYAIAEDGMAYVWGGNGSGQFGNNTCNSALTPIKVYKSADYPGTTYLGDNPNYPITDIGADGGSNGIAAMYMTGGDCKLYASGYNVYGELGIGDLAISEAHVPVGRVQTNSPGLCGRFARTSGSGGHVTMINPEGIVIGWGNNGTGQLGQGSGGDASYSVQVKVYMGQYSGYSFLGDVTTNIITDVANGNDHTLAVAQDGLVYAFGRNLEGQLGDASSTNRNLPVKVRKGQYLGTTYLGDLVTDKVSMVVANGHSIALTQTGGVYAWGANTSGSLGDNTTTKRTSPIRVLKGQYSGTTYLGDNALNVITSISAGYSPHSAALATDGTMYTWGLNSSGQLGDNSSTTRSTPVRVRKGQYSGTTYLGDNTANKITQIATGNGTTVALTADGTVYAWGYNTTGSVGDNTTTNRSNPVRVLKGQYSGTTYLGDNTANKITRLSVSGRTVAALAADGTIYSWGENVSGQLGDGTTTNRSTPVRMRKGTYPGTTYMGDDPSNKVTDIAGVNLPASSNKSSFICLTGTCYAYAVGDNSLGQFGNRTTTSSTSPVQVQFQTDLVLPVHLSTFDVILRNNVVDLLWTTASEVNNFATEIERKVSMSGQWERVGRPLAGYGTTNQPHSYSANDNVVSLRDPNGPVAVYYRLKFINLDGTFGYSEIKQVEILPKPADMNLTITPNPAQSNSVLTLSYSIPEQGHVVLCLYNSTGQLINTFVNKDLEAGSYEQRVETGNLSGGAMFWRLTVNGMTLTRQMHIIK